jgi:hypothetical protein
VEQPPTPLLKTTIRYTPSPWNSMYWYNVTELSFYPR